MNHDDDTAIQAVSWPAFTVPGIYEVCYNATIGFTDGATAPSTMGFDLIDTSGNNFWVLGTTFFPDFLLTANANLIASPASCTSFTVTSAQVTAGNVYVRPELDGFPVGQNVTIKKDSQINWSISLIGAAP